VANTAHLLTPHQGPEILAECPLGRLWSPVFGQEPEPDKQLDHLLELKQHVAVHLQPCALGPDIGLIELLLCGFELPLKLLLDILVALAVVVRLR